MQQGTWGPVDSPDLAGWVWFDWEEKNVLFVESSNGRLGTGVYFFFIFGFF